MSTSEMQVKEILKQAANIAYLIFSRLAGFVILGSVVNLMLLILLYPELSTVGVGKDNFIRWTSVLGIIGIMFAMVFLYFLVGKKYAVQTAICRVVEQKTKPL